MSKEEKKGTPIPVRFDDPEEAGLELLTSETGINKSEVIRRCVRYLAMEALRRNDSTFIAAITLDALKDALKNRAGKKTEKEPPSVIEPPTPLA